MAVLLAAVDPVLSQEVVGTCSLDGVLLTQHLYEAGEERHNDLWRISNLGAGVFLADDSLHHISPDVSPDGEWIAYLKVETYSDPHTYVTNVTTGETVNLDSGIGATYRPVWATSTKLLYLSYNREVPESKNELRLTELAGTQIVHSQTLTEAYWIPFYEPSPDGTKLAIVKENQERQQTLLVVDLETGSLSQEMALAKYAESVLWDQGGNGFYVGVASATNPHETTLVQYFNAEGQEVIEKSHDLGDLRAWLIGWDQAGQMVLVGNKTDGSGHDIYVVQLDGSIRNLTQTMFVMELAAKVNKNGTQVAAHLLGDQIDQSMVVVYDLATGDAVCQVAQMTFPVWG